MANNFHKIVLGIRLSALKQALIFRSSDGFLYLAGIKMKKIMTARAFFPGILVLVLFLKTTGAAAFQATIAQQHVGNDINVEKINSVRTAVYAWAESWAKKNIQEYMAHYSPNFRSEKLNYRQWREKKALVFQRPGAISIKISDLWVFVEGNAATASFIQKYRDSKHADIGEKVLKFVLVGDRWQIISEQWKPLKG